MSCSECYKYKERIIYQNCWSEHGFTLVEMLIAMAVGAVVMIGVMTAFTTQHKTYLVQDDVVEMQQNLRVALDLITSEIRTAGYDPTGNADAGIVTATPGRLGFTLDLSGDGDTNDANEEITIGFADGDDSEPNGIVDSGFASVGRNTGTATGIGGSGFQPVAENFYGIEFLYILEDATQVLNPTTAQLDTIRSIVVSLLAVNSGTDAKFTNSITYTTGSGATWGPFNDNRRRRLLVTTINCRNLGL